MNFCTNKVYNFGAYFIATVTMVYDVLKLFYSVPFFVAVICFVCLK